MIMGIYQLTFIRLQFCKVIRVRVVGVDSKKKELRCSMNLEGSSGPIEPGSTVLCRLRDEARATIDQALRVSVRAKIYRQNHCQQNGKLT